LKISYADMPHWPSPAEPPPEELEAWVGKYWEKKSSGEGDLNLQPESLD